jgi:hypothetical protein
MIGSMIDLDARVSHESALKAYASRTRRKINTNEELVSSYQAKSRKGQLQNTVSFNSKPIDLLHDEDTFE